MTRLVWTTDIHLDYVSSERITAFYNALVRAEPDAVLVTGDIAEGTNLEVYLQQLADQVPCPVYFVLGNHDYYDRSIQDVRAIMRQFNANGQGYLHWLSEGGAVELTPEVALVGHDGWSDGRYGDFIASTIELTDYRRITELIGLSPVERLVKLNQLGDEAAAYLADVLPHTLANYPQVVVALHPPPFQETCYYMDQPAEDDNPYLPHFTCKAVGDVLLRLASEYPDCDIKVLAGHTHHCADAKMSTNLHVMVADAEYGQPVINQIFDF